ncbi:MAG: GtrA family protein, partial [Wenzhouxiangellaceae bacterium]|nr:GtrA family protein [Wenzhouxiangellaceae bacterium]
GAVLGEPIADGRNVVRQRVIEQVDRSAMLVVVALPGAAMTEDEAGHGPSSLHGGADVQLSTRHSRRFPTLCLASLPETAAIPLRPLGRLFVRALRSPSQRATFFRFSCVGGSIAVVDAGLLYLLKDAPGFNVYTARIVSYTAAMSAGYLLNRYFTFHHLDSTRVLWDELVRFFSVHAAGGVLNFAVFALVVEAGRGLQLEGWFDALVPLLGVWIGGVVGMVFNYLLARRLVFDGPDRQPRGD